MDLLSKFTNHWHNAFAELTVNNCRLLVTVSGGLDSVVLLDLVARSGFQFEIAHCNFQLRGEESERDEEFVHSLGIRYGKEILVNHFNTQEYAETNKIAIQEAARELRYEWFGRIVDSWGATNVATDGDKYAVTKNFVVTAHHADDNIETLLMLFFRGTGIHGLTGITPLQKERKLIRPLLIFRKKDLSEYAQVNGLSFVEDSSNAVDKYTRNFFRNRLIPQIREVYPQVEGTLLENIHRFQEAGELYEQAVQQHIKKLAVPIGTEIHIPVLKWKKVQPLHTITWELIKAYGFSAAQTEEVIKLLDADNGAYRSSPTHRIIRNRQWMIISPVAAEEGTSHILLEAGNKEIVFEKGLLKITTITHPQIPHNNIANEALAEAAAIQFPLLVRKWKQGDYFYPLGMQKKKKLSRFFIDSKLSKTDKEKVWVIESNRKIIWVIGYRLDDRFKITPKTKTAVLFTFENNR
jgi:tRNA(Ile)-lysidine synthase